MDDFEQAEAYLRAIWDGYELSTPAERAELLAVVDDWEVPIEWRPDLEGWGYYICVYGKPLLLLHPDCPASVVAHEMYEILSDSHDPKRVHYAGYRAGDPEEDPAHYFSSRLCGEPDAALTIEPEWD